MGTKRFAHKSFDPVAADRAAYDTCSNGQPEARICNVVGAREDAKKCIRATSRIAIDAIKVGFLPESLRRGERPRARLQVPTTNAY